MAVAFTYVGFVPLWCPSHNQREIPRSDTPPGPRLWRMESAWSTATINSDTTVTQFHQRQVGAIGAQWRGIGHRVFAGETADVEPIARVSGHRCFIAEQGLVGYIMIRMFSELY